MPRFYFFYGFYFPSFLDFFVYAHFYLFICYALQAIYVADMIVVMASGRVKWVGSPADSSLASYISVLSLNEFNTFTEVQSNGKNPNLDGETEKPRERDCIISNPDEALDIVEVEARKEGSVESAVYK